MMTSSSPSNIEPSFAWDRWCNLTPWHVAFSLACCRSTRSLWSAPFRFLYTSSSAARRCEGYSICIFPREGFPSNFLGSGSLFASSSLFLKRKLTLREKARKSREWMHLRLLHPHPKAVIHVFLGQFHDSVNKGLAIKSARDRDLEQEG